MKTKSIEYFLAVVEDMSFTKAAQRLYISQQALSGHIQRLEEEYSVTLFERKPTLRLTEAGRMMAFYGQQILRSERYMQQAFADISTNCRGSLIVGMSRLRGSVVFPTLYERYHKRHPNIAVELVSGNTADLETMLMNNKLDVYLGLDAAPNPFETRLPIGQERTFCILTRRLLLEHYPDTWQDKLEQLKQEARLADLVDLPLITLRTGARLRASVDRVLSGIRKPDFLIECDQSTVAYKLALVMVAAIAGMAFDFLAFPYALPSSYLDKDWREDPEATGDDGQPDFPIATGYFRPFCAAMLRRACIIAAFVLAVALGL